MAIIPSSRIIPIEWIDEAVKIRWLDNTKIPLEESYNETSNLNRLSEAIKNLEIRGAPVLGEAGAFGVALAAANAKNINEEILKEVKEAARMLSATRPTAVNLSWGINKVLKKVEQAYENGESAQQMKMSALDEAKRIKKENILSTYKIGEFGRDLIEDGDTLMTVCNAGVLACDGIGTATAPMRAAWAQGKRFDVIVTETRPLLQGSRLTAWELNIDGIPTKVITDNAAAHIIESKKVKTIFAGADRILTDGSVYNKIGTFQLAILTKHFGNMNFYVAAPISTIDPYSTQEEVKIEQRSEWEVKNVMGKVLIAPNSVGALNPAFDKTPPELISGIITEKGIARFPYNNSIPKLLI